MKTPKHLQDRKKLRPEHILDSIEQVLSWFLTGYAPVYPEPPAGQPLLSPADNPPVLWQPLDKADITRLQTVLQVNLRLLNKVLPDLKAIDFTDHSDTSAQRFSDLELAQRVNSLLARRQHEQEKQLPTPEAWH